MSIADRANDVIMEMAAMIGLRVRDVEVVPGMIRVHMNSDADANALGEALRQSGMNPLVFGNRNDPRVCLA